MPQQPAAGQGSFEKILVQDGSSTPSGFKLVDFQNSSGTSKFSVDNSGNVVAAGTLAVTGATTQTGAFTPSGGIVGVTTAPKVNYAGQVAPVALTSGTDTAPVAGTIFYSQLFLPANATLTGVAVLNGSAVGTDKWIVALYNAAGAVVANSALAGVTAVGTAAFQLVPFTGTYAAKGPELYYVSLSCNGTTARFRSHAAGAHYTGSQTGVFGTLDPISSPATTFTADKGPICSTY